MRPVLVVILGLAVPSHISCSGSPTSPSTVATSLPFAGLPAGTSLSATSGETGAAVPGARFVIAGQAYVADGTGLAVLTQSAELGSLVDVQAPGFLDRQTLVRTREATRFVLWPRTTPTGLSEDYTAALVYTLGLETPPAMGSTPLRRHRIATQQVAVSLSDELRQDDSVVAAHRDAIASLNEAHAGRLAYVLAAERPPAGVVFEARVDAADQQCRERSIRAYTALSLSGFEITGGRIVYCALDVARTSTVAHELGHSAGLQHSPDVAEVMWGAFSRGRRGQFGPRESLALKLMHERRGGNRFPDSDREVAAAADATLVIACP